MDVEGEFEDAVGAAGGGEYFRDKLIVDFRRLQFGMLPNHSHPFCGGEF